MRKYAWVITKDHLADDLVKSAVGTIGPSNGLPLSAEEIQKHPKAQKFKMLDDDGERYYTGYFVNEGDASGFEPLDDFGMPNAGATTIEYYNSKEKKWEQL